MPVPTGPFHPHAQGALLPQPLGKLGMETQEGCGAGNKGAPEGAGRQGRVLGTASHSVRPAEKHKPICVDLKPTEGYSVGKRVGIE